MNKGCTFLRQKGEALHWEHSALFTYFKTEIQPFMRNVKQTCIDLLQFYHSIENHNVALTAEIERNYEIFMDIYRYQQMHELAHTILPPIEVQLMWITHCLHPVEYFCDCYRRYKKLVDVNLLCIPSKLTPHQTVPVLHDFQTYTKRALQSTNRKLAEITNSVRAQSAVHHVANEDNQWFIHDLHMKNSILQELEFMNQINFIQSQHLYANYLPSTPALTGHGYESATSSSSGKSGDGQITLQAIQKAMDRYCKFLYLMALPEDKRPAVCVPTIDVDLVWHAHILNFHDYHAMSKSLYPLIGAIPHRYYSPNGNTVHGMKACWDGIFGAGDYLQGRPFFVDKALLKVMKDIAKQKKQRRPYPDRNVKHAHFLSVPGVGVSEFERRLNSVEKNVKMLSLQISEIAEAVKCLVRDTNNNENDEELKCVEKEKKVQRRAVNVGGREVKQSDIDVYRILNALRSDMCLIKQSVAYNKKEENVKKWLSNNVGLPQYFDMFLEHGLDDWDIIKQLNDQELRKIGVTKFGTQEENSKSH